MHIALNVEFFNHLDLITFVKVLAPPSSSNAVESSPKIENSGTKTMPSSQHTSESDSATTSAAQVLDKSTGNGLPFTFPVPKTSMSLPEPPPTPTLSQPPSIPSADGADIPKFTFGSSSTTGKLVFSFDLPSSSHSAEEAAPTFKFGSDTKRELSFDVAGKDAVCFWYVHLSSFKSQSCLLFVWRLLRTTPLGHTVFDLQIEKLVAIISIFWTFYLSHWQVSFRCGFRLWLWIFSHQLIWSTPYVNCFSYLNFLVQGTDDLIFWKTLPFLACCDVSQHDLIWIPKKQQGGWSGLIKAGVDSDSWNESDQFCRKKSLPASESDWGQTIAWLMLPWHGVVRRLRRQGYPFIWSVHGFIDWSTYVHIVDRFMDWSNCNLIVNGYWFMSWSTCSLSAGGDAGVGEERD